MSEAARAALTDDIGQVPLADHPDAVLYEQCGLQDFQEEPLYQRLCRLVARSPRWLALHDAAPPNQRRATLWLAALHDEVLALGRPEGLGAWFASVGGQRPPDDPELPAALAAFVDAREAGLRHSIATRHTQTNEIGRCAVLWPALSAIAERTGRPRLALFDFGASAGLNLGVDRYRIQYLGPDRVPLTTVGPSDPGRPVLSCRVHGEAPRWTPWSLAARLGADLLPADPTDPRALRWLRACLWPGDAQRAQRLAQAALLAQQAPLPVQASADGLALLSDWLDSLPADVQPVLWHCWVLAYFDDAGRAAFARQARSMVSTRGLAWLSAEDGPVTQALTGLAGPRHPVHGEPRGDPAAQTLWTLTLPERPRLLARSHPHGTWLQWLDPA